MRRDWNAWVPLLKHDVGKPMLVCLPHAGGGISQYVPWARWARTITVCPVLLPGRESRILEPPLTNLSTLVSQLADVIHEAELHDYALFGHSLGALLAYELYRELGQRRIPLPQMVFVSGRGAPDCHVGQSAVLATDSDLLQKLREYTGTPEAVLRNAALVELLLPTVRADFMLNTEYVFVEKEKLAHPLVAMMGDSDPFVDEADVDAWSRHAAGGFEKRTFQGDHFFPFAEEDGNRVLAFIEQRIRGN